MIKELGVAAYGMIALSNTIPAYIQLFTKSITNSVFRFVAVHHNRDETDVANEYFNTAFWSLILLNVPLLTIAVLVSVSFSSLFEVPDGLEFETNILAFAMFLSCIVGTSAAILKIPYLLTHNFLLQNLLLVSARIIGVAVLLVCFWIGGASLIFVGVYQLSFQLFAIFLLMVVRNRVETTVQFVGWQSFKRDKLRKLFQFGRWVFVNDLAVLLYLAIGILVINKILGADATGRFGPIMLLNSLLIMIGGALGTAMMPMFFSLVNYDDKKLLNTRFLQVVRILGLVSGFLVLVISGLSRQILELWLDASFIELWPLIWMTAFSTWLGGICFIPSNQIYRALDRVSAVAVWNLLFGVIHISTTLFLMLQYELGLWAFGLSYMLNFGLKNIIINCFFTSRYMEQSPHNLPLIVSKLGLLTLSLSVALFWVADQITTSWANLTLLFLFAGIVYSMACLVMLSGDDLKMVTNLINRKKMPASKSEVSR